MVLLTALLLLVGLALSGCADPAPDGDRAGTRHGPRHEKRPSTPRGSATPSVRPSLSVELPELRAPASYDRPVTGADVSWPQCPKGMGIPEKPAEGSPMPLSSARFVVLGLTNGPAFTPNPCLADQVRWVQRRHLMAAAYSVTSFPDRRTLARHGSDGPYDGDTPAGALGNVGYQQALFNLRTMRAAGLLTPIIWVDVEPVSDFEWSPDREANAAVVRGVLRGYADAGFRVGVYSTQLLWETVVGDLTLGLPEWRAAGETSRAEALRRCGPELAFQGGRAVLGQWLEDNRDHNVTCPGTSRDMFRWFVQY